jgi:archaetidylinositol phosphate synthase
MRKPFQPLFDGLGRGLVKLKMTPNIITCFAFFIGVASAVFIGLGKPYLALLLLWLSGIMDVLDGTVARLTGKSSLTGAYIDLIFDRMVEAIIILGFVFLEPSSYLAYIVFLISVIFNFTTFIVAGALFKNTGMKSIHYDCGIVERTEAFIVFSLMILFEQYIFLILMSFNLLVFITGIIRFIKIIKHNKGLERY